MRNAFSEEINKIAKENKKIFRKDFTTAASQKLV